MNTTLFIADKIDFNCQDLADTVSYLNAEELCRFEKIKIDKDKIIFALSRKILKLALAHYYPHIDKKDWVFAQNSYGKPYINSPKLPVPLYFNLSHSVDAIAVAISRDSEVGVDIERVRSLDRAQVKSTAHLNISQNFFTENEYRNIISLTYDEGFLLFWKLWTIKEAYIKYRGMGLSLGLNCIDIDLSANSILLNTCDNEVSIHQWINNNLIIALSAAKSVNDITLFRYDMQLTLHSIVNYEYIHN
ncbi:4'-phosphopantetheinyl transferase family protein [Gilliamella sp. App4-10]|uniref:4'-phosphopantetheinyl transferase family protein n=1 Tax=Gilliamella sp. App4-10 TaxID=3120231 RepID=UPI00080DE7A3|nr:4'-phosphopantetheinyl transferase superfamily protein [Gilliamella apicola]OCG21791.1 hypothetical protein A9G23_04255 [Gilliamella apicola]